MAAPAPSPAPRHQVWARVVWDVLEIANRASIDPAPLTEGLPFDAKSVRRMRRVAWDDYCTLVERLAEHIGGLDELARFSADNYHRTSPELTAIAAALVSPKTLFRLVYEVFSPLLFPMVEFSYEDRGPNRVHLEAWLRPGVRPCLALHYGVVGAMRGMPRHLGLGPAVVTGEIEADHLALDIELPRSRTLASRVLSRSVVRRALGATVILGYDAVGTAVRVGLGRAAIDDVDARIRRAAAGWHLTPRQTDVLEVLVRGKANKEIAQALDCAENTVELHVTHLLRRAGVDSRTQLIARFFDDS
jgi:DNA-binding CsgD family transcriptional regulator